MSAVLFTIGILLSLIGLFAIGFGVPINEFGLGNTLIVAGTTGVAGGVVTIGLAAAVRELRKLTKALEPPAQRHADVVLEPSEAPARTSKFQPAPKQAAVPSRGQQRAEPRLDTQAMFDTPSSPDVAPRPRPGFFSVARGGAFDPPIVEEAETVPLSPAPALAPKPQLQPLTAGAGPNAGAEPAPEPPASPRGTARPFFTRSRTQTDAERSAERAARNLFDTVWPSDPKAKSDTGGDKKPDAGSSSSVNPFDAIIAATPAAPREDKPPQPAPAIDAKPASILKSGVIDGMAYTLYTDGSIEAQLPQGVVRFASIDELREHLDNQP